jgi:hypothetical protein
MKTNRYCFEKKRKEKVISFSIVVIGGLVDKCFGWLLNILINEFFDYIKERAYQYYFYKLRYAI